MSESKMNFDELLEDILENPEKVMTSDLSEEELLALYKKMNPLAHNIDDGLGDDRPKKAVAASYTNLREQYLRRFTMTSIIGFLYRMFKEWEVPAEDLRWEKEVSNVSETLPSLDELEAFAASFSETVARAREYDTNFNNLETEAVTAEFAEDENRSEKRFQANEARKSKVASLYECVRQTHKLGQFAGHHMKVMTNEVSKYSELLDIVKQDRVVQNELFNEVPKEVAKSFVGKFLGNWLNYDPDLHVKSVYNDEKMANEVKDGVDTIDPQRPVLATLRAPAPLPTSDEDSDALKQAQASHTSFNSMLCVLRNESLAEAVQHMLKDEETRSRFRSYLYPVSEDSEVRFAIDTIPPSDTFHRLNYYMEVNYEKLRLATESIYADKPDLEWALSLYEFFEGTTAEVDAAFDRYRRKHSEELVTDLKMLEFGAWTLLCDFKENRKNMQFYNKQTEVLKRIMDRFDDDKKLGQDLMRNRVKINKAKNIRESGPDAPRLEEYRSLKTGVASLGAEQVISAEEMKRLEKARGSIKAARELEYLDEQEEKIRELDEKMKYRPLDYNEQKEYDDAKNNIIQAKEMLSVPEDSVQVDVFSHDTTSGTFKKSKFYSACDKEDDGEAKTEAPLAPYVDNY